MGLQSYLLHPALQGLSSHVHCVYVAYAVHMCLCSLCSSRVHCVNVAYVEQCMAPLHVCTPCVCRLDRNAQRCCRLDADT